MRILQVYKNYYPTMGGIENAMRLLCEELARRGHEVTALVANDGKGTVREVLAGVQVIRAGSLGTVARTPLSPQLFWEMARLRPEITHLHFPYPLGELAHLLVGHGRRTVITYHSDIIKQRTLLHCYEPFLRRSLARAKRIIATSPNYVRSSRFLRAVAEKCTVIPLCIDAKRLANVDPAAVDRVRAGYGQPLLLFVGVFRYYKGLEYLIRAMRDVPGHLVLVGAGPVEAELRLLVERQSLSDRVHFVGAVPDADLAAYYHACDVFILPSSQRSEALGLAQIEAMTCGKPVICTELDTGTSFVNQNEVTGLVVAPRDSSAIATALKRLLGDEQLCRRMGLAAAVRARDEFSAALMFDRVEALYRELLAS